MKPVSPVLYPELRDKEVIYAKNQASYNNLPSIVSEAGVVLSRWTLSEDERMAIAIGSADVYLSIYTFGERLQPVKLEVMTEAGKGDLARRMGLDPPTGTLGAGGV